MLTSSALINDGGQLAELYNRATFLFAHRLHELPIFDVENLVELSRRLPAAHYEIGDADVGDGWGGVERDSPTLQETLASMSRSNALVLLKGVAHDPEFAPVFQRIFAELVDRVGSALRTDIAESRATLIVNSPHRLTPYHIDAETNFLFQVRGQKIVNVFDPTDRSILTNLELERFYGGDFSAAAFKPDRQSEAFVAPFGPGDAIHIPLHAPHWTRSGDSVSVAISVNISLKSNRRAAQLYKMNHLLRKTGLSPAPPGAHPWADRVKLAAAGGIALARRGRRSFKTMNGSR